MRCSLRLLCWLGGSAVPFLIPVEAAPVLVVPIEGELMESTVALVVRSVRRAEELGASHLVFEIDTPVGRIDRMNRIALALEDTNTRTVAFVRQSAVSAGALIALACDELYMTPGSHIGSALPIYRSILPLPPEIQELQDQKRSEEEEKMISAFRALFRAKAQQSGRNEWIAEAMVDPQIALLEITLDGERSVVTEQKFHELEELHGTDRVRRLRVVCEAGKLLNLTALEAEELRFVDAIVPGRHALLEVLGVPDAPLLELSVSWSEQFADWISRWGWFLLPIGLLALFLELKVPGFGLPGIIGIACLALVIFGKYLAGLADVAEILLILGGLVLIAVEIFLMPGTLIPGIAGAIALVAGIVLAFQSVDLPGSADSITAIQWWSNTRNLALSIVGGIIGMFAAANLLPGLPLFQRGLQAPRSQAERSAAMVDDVHRGYHPSVGAAGRALSPLRPAGKILVDGRELHAVTEGAFLDEGTAVRVIRVEGNRIVVRAG